ncbi:cell envelope integrity protein TolA [Ramlibacter sp. PS3R-8]|uniref:cell envelope integrity protein TolA n=1 Tax=Ramlibacter sp. PS3R-8 TaxID=3133437 RepID=UPI00309BF123
MHATADRLDFAPPPQPGLTRALGLAVVAHLLLAAALMHGLRWKTDTQATVAEAELWSSVPRQAAPREVVQPPPPPPPPPPPVVRAPPPPPPVVKTPPQPEPPVQRQADIALEREKQRRERELERRELEKREAAKRKQEDLARERDQRRKLEAQKKQREEDLARKKEEQARAVAEAKRKEEADRKRQQEQQAREAREAQRVAQQREENMRRIQGMAGSGAPDATGNAARSSGPSASWGSRVQARVKPNIVFSDDSPGNPEAVVEVRLAPDGTIVSRRIKKASGNKAWDDAVLRALDRTEVLPRDTDGRVPPGGDLVFRPRG